MNHTVIIGNLTGDPESRTTQSGVNLCTFTVAVNRRQTANAGQPEADFFRVTAWRQLADICQKYLAKGRKVAVAGKVSANAFIARDGNPRAALELQADDVEFLTPQQETQQAAPQKPQQQNMNGFVQVEEPLPF